MLEKSHEHKDNINIL